MPHEARDLDLVHREDHRGRRTRSSEHFARRGQFRDRRAATAELGWNVRAQEPFLAQRVDGLLGKAAFAIDRIGRSCGDRLGNDAGGVWHSPGSRLPASRSRPEQLGQTRMNRGDRRKRTAPQHPLGELDVEPLLEGQHQRDAGVRRQAGFVETAVVGQAGFVNREPTVLAKHLANPLRNHITHVTPRGGRTAQQWPRGSLG